MPQLQNALETYVLMLSYQAIADDSYSPSGSSPEGGLTNSLKQLFSGMSKTTEPVAPFLLLNSLRALAPQFSETDRSGNFAQQGESAESQV
jgi:hypothetical protein